MTAHTPGKYVMEGELNGKPFTREFVAIEDYTAMKAIHDDLLEIVKRSASECAECGGDGRVLVTINAGDAEYEDCGSCADIRAVIAKAEGAA